MHRPLPCAAIALGIGLLTLTATGCGGGGDAQAARDASPEQAAANSSADSPQAAVVREFLQAVQQGNRDAARELLTATSVQKIDEHNLPFLPEAIDSGTFGVGQTVQRGETFFVQCVWTDQDASGQPRSENIQWMVKQERGASWGIFGMAVHMPESPEPLVINFEQPDELVRRQEPAPTQQDSAPPQTTTGGQAPAHQAGRPQDPFQSAPR